MLLGAEVLFCPFFVASRGLMGGGWTRVTGLIGAVGCVAAVALYLVLVPLLGTVGACLASAIVYLGLSVATVVALDVRLRTRAADAPMDQTAPDDPSLDPSLTA